MPSYKVAHVKQSGVDLIIIPLESSFGSRTPEVQHSAIADLQLHASAKLAGTVVPVWDAGGGRMAYIAPPQWQAFFSSINLPWVMANINRNLYW